MSIVIMIPVSLAIILLSYLAWHVGGNAALRRAGQRGMGVAIVPVAAIVITTAGATWLFASEARHAEVRAAEIPASTPAQAPNNAGGELNALVERLEGRLRRETGDAQGWALLARTQLELRNYPSAVQAYAKAMALLPNEVDFRVEYAEAEFLAHDQQWTNAAIDATDIALALKPDHPEALWLAGTQRFAKKDHAAAVRIWEKLLKAAPANFDHARELATTLVEARALRDGKNTAAALAAAGVGARRSPVAGLSSTGAPSDENATLARELHATLRSAGSTHSVARNAAPGKHVTGEVALQPALRGRVAQDATVFIFARADGGGKPAMPLAAKRYRVTDLPIHFDLSDADAMSPEFRLSSASRVVIVARISRTGEARAQAGDFEGISPATDVGSEGVSVLIDKPL